jgi:hypothetical protein
MAWLRLYKAIRPMPGFLIDEAPTNARYTSELFATVRADGRVIDHTRYVIGGSDILEASFDLDKLFTDPDFEGWTVNIQRFPRDVDVRRGMLSGPWHNLIDVAASRNASFLDRDGAEIPVGEFIRRAKDADSGPQVGAIRWAIILNDASKLALMLQGLPATASQLMGKPSMKR